MTKQQDNKTSYFLGAEDLGIESITVGELLRRTANAASDSPALTVYGEHVDVPPVTLSYAQLLEKSEIYATSLLQHFDPGDSVAIWLPNCAEWPLIQFGAALAGLVLVTVNPASTDREVAYVLDQSEVKGIVCCQQYRGIDIAGTANTLADQRTQLHTVLCVESWSDELKEVRPDVSAFPVVTADQPAMIQYTSGTTGNPKGAILSHKGLVNSSRRGEVRFALDAGSIWLNVMPMFHTGGCVFMTLGCLWNRGVEVMLPGLDPGMILVALEKDKVDYTTMVPTMVVRVMEHPEFGEADLSQLKLVSAGGSAIAPSIVNAIESKFGADFMMIFGQTEACGTLCTSLREDTIEHRTETIGTPIPNTEVCIMSTNSDEILPVNEIGEICVRSEFLFTGYFGMEEETSKAFTGDGWYRTGDLGEMLGDGYLRITGRSKDMIIRGGENIYPREVEDLLVSHDDIAEAAVFGIPDAEWGEQVVAAVRPVDHAEINTDDIRDFLLSKLARFKVPKFWWETDSFPTTASGKVQKHVLRDNYMEMENKS